MDGQRVKYTWTVVMALLGFRLAACDTMDGENLLPAPPKEPGLFAFAAEFPPNGEARIVLAPFDDPSTYQLITDLYGIDPRFSPDKSNLLFSGYRVDHIPNNYIYHIEDRSIEPIVDVQAPNSMLHSDSETAVWERDGTGFYFTPKADLFTPFEIYFHRFEDQKSVLISNRGRPVDRIGHDSLIVNASDEHGSGFFLFDVRSKTFTRIANPHLDREAMWPAIRFLDWNDTKKLLVFVDVKDGQRAQLAITNLDGSFHKTLTTGAFDYNWPRWGPENEVLFWRQPVEGSAEIATINIETREVRTLLRKDDLGASALYHIDY